MKSRNPTNRFPGKHCDKNELSILPPAAITRRTALSAAALLAIGWNTSATTQQVVMPDPRIKTYETYLSAWSAVADEERAKRLRECLSENILFTNPTQTRRGLTDVAAHLLGFQQRVPGGSFRLNEMLGWENHGIATWQLVDAQGQPGFWGYDVLAFDAQGRIESILLFSHLEKQILK
jgi:hypothetical protein